MVSKCRAAEERARFKFSVTGCQDLNFDQPATGNQQPATGTRQPAADNGTKKLRVLDFQ
jgi:hypothetical protein